MAVTIPMAVVLGRLDDDRTYTRLLLVAFAAKMLGAYIRYTVLYNVYSGGDASRYYDVGLELATQIEQGNDAFGEISGTRFITTVKSPIDIPIAAVTILFRPFIWEASSGQSLLTAAEGLVLMALSWRQLWALPKTMLRHPYVLYCFVFTLAFIVAYSSFNNFGLLVRQRAQMFPFFLVLLTPFLTRADEDEDKEAATVPTRKPAKPHTSPTVKGRTRRGSFQPAERPI